MIKQMGYNLLALTVCVRPVSFNTKYSMMAIYFVATEESTR